MENIFLQFRSYFINKIIAKLIHQNQSSFYDNIKSNICHSPTKKVWNPLQATVVDLLIINIMEKINHFSHIPQIMCKAGNAFLAAVCDKPDSKMLKTACFQFSFMSTMEHNPSGMKRKA